MKCSCFSPCFLSLCLLPLSFSWKGNKWSRLYRLKLRSNICIDKSRSQGSSNSSTSNLLSFSTVLTWLLFSGMIWFRFYSSWITVEDAKSRSQEKHVKLYSNFSSLLSHETNSLFQRRAYKSWLRSSSK